jgi:hypothetical protein
VPQHERKKINDINSPPFVLSAVEGLLAVFQHSARRKSITHREATSKGDFRVRLSLLASQLETVNSNSELETVVGCDRRKARSSVTARHQ